LALRGTYPKASSSEKYNFFHNAYLKSRIISNGLLYFEKACLAQMPYEIYFLKYFTYQILIRL